MIEPVARLTPHVHASCFVHPLAAVMGQVTLGENVSVFPSAVLRGDIAAISVGKNSNIQDAAVLHVNYGCPCEIGANVSVGHGAVVHGSKIADNVIIGMNATVMECEIGPNCVIGAGAVVERAVIAENARVGAGARIGVHGGELCVLGPDSWIAPNAVVDAGESVEPNATVE